MSTVIAAQVDIYWNLIMSFLGVSKVPMMKAIFKSFVEHIIYIALKKHMVFGTKSLTDIIRVATGNERAA
ncbi:MAG: hypothetical protein ACXVC3_19020 [Bdellovibrio sp.]